MLRPLLLTLLALLVLASAASARPLDTRGPSRAPLPPRTLTLVVVGVSVGGVEAPPQEQLEELLVESQQLQSRISWDGLRLQWRYAEPVHLAEARGICGRRSYDDTTRAQRLTHRIMRQRDDAAGPGEILLAAYGNLGCSWAGYGTPKLVRRGPASVQLQGWGQAGYYQATTLVHELGHAMGLWHAARSVCGDPARLGQCWRGEWLEYHDPLDLMGMRSAAYGYSAYTQTLLGLDHRIRAARGINQLVRLPSMRPDQQPTTLVVPTSRTRALFIRAHGGASQEELWAQGMPFGGESLVPAPGIEVQQAPWRRAGMPVRAFVGGSYAQAYRDATHLAWPAGSVLHTRRVTIRVTAADTTGSTIQLVWRRD